MASKKFSEFVLGSTSNLMELVGLQGGVNVRTGPIVPVIKESDGGIVNDVITATTLNATTANLTTTVTNKIKSASGSQLIFTPATSPSSNYEVVHTGNISTLVPPGVTDHGALTGLGDNDHPQYALLAGAEFTGPLKALPPVSDTDVVTKKYMEDQLATGALRGVQYKWGNTTQSAPASGYINVFTKAGGGGNDREIRMSTTDANGYPRSAAFLLIGDTMILSTSATSFARYMVVGAPVDFVTSWMIPCKRTDTSGSQTPPPTNTIVTLTGVLSGTDVVEEYIPLSQKGAADGVAPLNASGHVPLEYISITTLNFIGGWNAAPGILPPDGNSGDCYLITAEGTLTVIPPNSTDNIAVPTLCPNGSTIIYAQSADVWYLATASTAINDSRYVQLTGSTMTGHLSVPAGATGSQVQRASEVATLLAAKAPLASPALTGSPTAPTQTAGDNSTKLATTAYVFSAIASKANVNSPNFTGVPTAPNPTAGDSSTQVATTSFVKTTADASAAAVGNNIITKGRNRGIFNVDDSLLPADGYITQAVFGAGVEEGYYVPGDMLTQNRGFTKTELIANGRFDYDNSWVKGTNVTISGGKATTTGTSNNVSMLRQVSIPVTSGRVYTIKCDSTKTSGTTPRMKLSVDSVDIGDVKDTGTHTFTFTATATRTVTLDISESGGGTWVGSVDNISMTWNAEVLPVPEQASFTYLGDGWLKVGSDLHTVTGPNTSVVGYIPLYANTTGNMVDGGFDPNIKANVASPAFTGTPTAPTAANTVNNTQIATTAFVKSVTATIGGDVVGPASSTNNYLAQWNGTTGKLLKAGIPTSTFATPASVALKADTTYVDTELAKKANLAGPTFTGIPAAPTAAAGNNTTQLATTAFVTTATASKANLTSPAFTGTPTAPTAPNGTNTTQLATTAFVLANSGGSGNVTGPASATADAIALFNGATGKIIKAGPLITTSAIDTTAGRVTKVGDFGLGGSNVAPLVPGLVNSDTTVITGFYTVGGGLPGTYPVASGGQLLHIERGTSGAATQTFWNYIANGNPRQWFRQRYSGGTWSGWVEVWTTANLVKTASATDTTAGRMLKVGDFGLGAYSVTITDPDVVHRPTGFYEVIPETAWANRPQAGWTRFIHQSHNNPTGYATQWAAGDWAGPNPLYWVRNCSNGVWSAWKQIQTVDDSGWITPTFTNGFYDANNFKYRKLNGVVYIKGALGRANTWPGYTQAFSLPAGFRPATPTANSVQQVFGSGGSGLEMSMYNLIVESNGSCDIGFVYNLAGTPTGSLSSNISISFIAGN